MCVPEARNPNNPILSRKCSMGLLAISNQYVPEARNPNNPILSRRRSMGLLAICNQCVPEARYISRTHPHNKFSLPTLFKQ